MAGIFSSPKVQAPPPPTVPPPPPGVDEAEAKGQRAADQLRMRRGMASTILTGVNGIQTDNKTTLGA